LGRWLAGEEIRYSTANNPNIFYSKIRSLLGELGSDSMETRTLIRQAVFEERAWPREASDPRGQLLLRVRELVADRWGGEIPVSTGILGVAPQTDMAPLTRWLSGEELQYTSKNTAQSFYAQIRALLGGLGVDAEESQDMIRRAIFTERGWPEEADNPQAQLLLEARELVADHSGGSLLQTNTIEGLAWQVEGSILKRWLDRGEVQFRRHNTSEKFYRQVRALLGGLGMGRDEIRGLTRRAIFAERNWPRQAREGQGQLLLRARELIADRWGGGLLVDTGIEGLAKQKENSSLRCWIEGRGIQYQGPNTPLSFYGQVRALLEGLGVSAEETQSLVRHAIFAERNWPEGAIDGRGRLLLRVRELVADRWGGLLTRDLGLEGLPWQQERAPLTRWVAGEEMELSPRLLEQIRTFLRIGGGMDPQSIEALIGGVGGEGNR